MRVIRYREAVREAMIEEMRRDESVFLMGEEVGHYQGAYKVSEGMLEIFGQKRVVDTGWDPAPRRERTGDADGAGRDAAPEPAMAARIAPPRGAPTPPPPPTAARGGAS